MLAQPGTLWPLSKTFVNCSYPASAKTKKRSPRTVISMH